MSPKVTFVTRLFTQPPHRLGPIMPSANNRRRYNSDSGKTKIQERRKQSKRGAQVSFLCLAFTFMAFPAESEYNEGKGLMISATLHGKLPPPKPGDKRRSNAKLPVINKVVYIHENTTFINMMVAVIRKSFLRGDLLIGGLDKDGRLQPGTPFTLEYSIPHNTTFKDIELASKSDWDMFVEKMKDTAKAGGKLTIREKVL